MNTVKKTAAFFIAVIIAVSACVSCNSDSTVSRLKENGGLRVGYCSSSEVDDAPFLMEGQDGKLTEGITGNPAAKAAHSLGVDPLFTRLDSSGAYDSLMQGSVDCLWNCPPPSKKLVSSVRTIETGLYYRQVIMTLSDSNINRLADVKDKRLAVVSGSDAQRELHNASVMKSSLKKITVCSNIQQVIQKLASGDVDCAAVDEPQSLWAASNYNDGKTEFKYIDTPIAECSLVIVTRADDADLCSRIAEEYVSMAQQGKIKELCQSYDLNVLLSSAIKNNPEEAST